MRNLAAAAAAFLILLASAAAFAADPEPTYRERTAAQWAPLLRDRDDDTRLLAVTAVLAIGKDTNPDPIVALVAPLLDDPIPLIRARACRWLAVTGHADAKAVKVAAAMIVDRSLDPAFSIDAALALAAMGVRAKEALPAVDEAIKSLEERRMNPKDKGDTAVLKYDALQLARKAIADAKP